MFSQIAHLDFEIPLPHILLPLALSFVTFQQIAFLFDCYKHATGQSNKNLNSKNIDFIDYALFISFFPQLIAGPIVHHREMMPQFAKMGNSSLARPSRELEKFSFDRQPALSQSNFSAQPTNLTQDTRIANDLKKSKDSSLRVSEANAAIHNLNSTIDCHDSATFNKVAESRNDRINYEFLAKGIFIFSIGLFKKVFIADSFAKWANAGFGIVENGGVLNIAESWATSLSYTFQLYFDFSGYCDMAMGLALMFGIILPLNFNSPYKSLNIAEFWRRWHITLGRFLKECLYIPLGGSRVSKILNLRNLFIVAFLSGIWHGAGWGFVIWGVLHGVAMVIHRIYAWWIGNLSLGIHSVDLANRHKARTQSPLSLCRFAKNYESNTANTSIVCKNAEFKNFPLPCGGGLRGWVKLHFIHFTQSKIYKILAWFITFNFVNIAWVFFRAENVSGAVNLLKGMFGIVWVDLPQKWHSTFSALSVNANEMVAWITIALLICVWCRNSVEKMQNYDRFTPLKSAFATILIIASFGAMLFANRKIEFLYFNF
ncbi:MBOAT family O-acyltransferase [Helicobacter sp. 23-1044]